MNSNTEKKPAKTRLFAQLDSQAETETPIAATSTPPEFSVKSAPPPRPPQELLDEVAAQHGFDSRQPARQPTVAAVAAPTEQPTKKPRRQRVVRTEQLNLRVTESTLSRFYALTDNLQVPMGELLDRLLNEYERNHPSPKSE